MVDGESLKFIVTASLHTYAASTTYSNARPELLNRFGSEAFPPNIVDRITHYTHASSNKPDSIYSTCTLRKSRKGRTFHLLLKL